MQRLFDDVWNGRRFDLIDEFYAAEYVVDYQPYTPLRHGREVVREMVERAYATMPDYHEECCQSSSTATGSRCTYVSAEHNLARGARSRQPADTSNSKRCSYSRSTRTVA